MASLSTRYWLFDLPARPADSGSVLIRGLTAAVAVSGCSCSTKPRRERLAPVVQIVWTQRLSSTCARARLKLGADRPTDRTLGERRRPCGAWMAAYIQKATSAAAAAADAACCWCQWRIETGGSVGRVNLGLRALRDMRDKTSEMISLYTCIVHTRFHLRTQNININWSWSGWSVATGELTAPQAPYIRRGVGTRCPLPQNPVTALSTFRASSLGPSADLSTEGRCMGVLT